MSKKRRAVGRRGWSFATMFVAAWLLASRARGDELVQASVYAAAKRPLGAPVFPGPPDITRNISGAALEWVHSPPVGRTGWVARVGAAVEYQADCAWEQASCPFPTGGGYRYIDEVEYVAKLPRNHVETGAHARVGWFWKHVQLEAGGEVHTYTSASTYRFGQELGSLSRPDVVLRLGTRDTFFAVGYGVYAAPTILAPGGYVQGAVRIADRWATAATVGYADAEYRNFRFDLEMRYRVTEQLMLGWGLASTWVRGLGDDEDRKVGNELRLQLGWLL